MNIIEIEPEIKNGGILDIIDTTENVEEPFSRVEFKNVISPLILGSTGVVTTTRHELSLLKDLPDAQERIASKNSYYKHEKMRHGHSIIGPSITLLLKIGKMRFDTWQQLIFLEPDVGRGTNPCCNPFRRMMLENG